MPRIIPAEAPRSVATTTILSDGVELPRTFHLLAAVVNREVNRIPWARLTLRDGSAATEGFALSDEDFFAPGKTIELRSGFRGEEQPVFKGLVMRHAIKLRREGSVLLVECRHKAAAMTVAPRSRYFADITDGDAISDILSEYSISADVAATPVTHPSLVQYAATDWDFMLCRAEAAGLLCTIADDSIKLQPPDLSGTTTLTIQHGATMHDLDAEIDARLQPEALKTSAWNPDDEEVEQTDAAEPSVPAVGNLSGTDLAAAHAKNLSLAHDGHLKSPELQAWADATLLRHRLGRIRGKVRTDGTAAVAPGGYIELAGVGERFEGSHFVSGVRQQIENGVWETVIQFGLNPEPFAGTYDVAQPLAGGLLPPVQGLHIGIVTDGEDPESVNRVKVRLPIVDADDEGTWARLATLDAGNERGFVFRPEVGDEVLVSFIDNDPRHPVVLGGLFNGQKAAPFPATADNHKKGFRSRAGHRLEFNDEPGSESILVETPGGNSLSMADGDKVLEIKDNNGHSIKLEAAGITVTTSGGNTIKLLDSPSSIELTDSNGNSVKLEAAGITLAAAAKLTLQGGQVEITAGQVSVNAGMAQFAGVVQTQTLISTAVIASTYTPGAGNVM